MKTFSSFQKALSDTWNCYRLFLYACMCTHSPHLCPTLGDPMGYSPPGFSVHGILQARMLEWVSIPFSRNLPDPRNEPASLKSPALAGRFFTTTATWEALSLYHIPDISFLFIKKKKCFHRVKMHIVTLELGQLKMNSSFHKGEIKSLYPPKLNINILIILL